jgi:hypothetical protein
MRISLDQANPISLAQFRAANGIDGAYDSTPTWPFRIGRIKIEVPNFSWRRAAIHRHDIHHLITGYPFTMGGEYQVATWEFAAGRYPHPGASLLLLPLVAIGAIWSPRAIWRAFVRGRRSTSLFRPEFRSLNPDTPLPASIAMAPASESVRGDISDGIAFALLLAQSTAVIAVLPAAIFFIAAAISGVLSL